MDTEELEKRLTKAREGVEALVKRRWGGPELEAAFAAVERAERELAAAKGEPYAVPFEIGFRPESAVPAPLLLQDERHTALIFRSVKKDVDGRVGTFKEAGWAVIECINCHVSQFGYPNDEALPGHPLSGKGLGPYDVYEVINSKWAKQLTEQNRVAFPNTPDSKQRHFIIVFHDSSFECIADRIEGRLSGDSFEAVAGEVFKQVTRADSSSS